MSQKGQALKKMVMERLVVAADEIFALFERTLAEYEEEALRSKLLREEPHNKDAQTVAVNAEVCPSPDHSDEEQTVCVKLEDGEEEEEEEEEEIPVEFQFSPVSVKTENDLENSALRQQGPPERNIEKPGCSFYLRTDKDEQTYSSYDTDISGEWEPSAKRLIEFDGKESNVLLRKDLKRGRTAQKEILTLMDESCERMINNNNDNGGSAWKRKIKQHKCSECGKAFQRDTYLRKHMLIHSGQSPYRCTVCDKGFTDKSSFKKHISIHSEEKPFSCVFCQKDFRQKYHLTAHMRIHTGEKPYSCSDCGVSFRHQHNLFRHTLTVHKREKPYGCPVCVKAFAQKSHFDIHLRTHTGEKPFSCTICNKGFGAKCHLKKHIKTHAVVQNEVPCDINPMMAQEATCEGDEQCNQL